MVFCCFSIRSTGVDADDQIVEDILQKHLACSCGSTVITVDLRVNIPKNATEDKKSILRPKELSNNSSQFYHEDEPIHMSFKELRQLIEKSKRGGLWQRTLKKLRALKFFFKVRNFSKCVETVGPRHNRK